MEDPWSLSPSGSGAQDQWPDETYYDTFDTQPVDVHAFGTWDEQQQHDEETALSANVYGASELAPGQLMSTKVPPAFNGRGSWFAYEEMVLDWLDMTIVPPERQGPALKSQG